MSAQATTESTVPKRAITEGRKNSESLKKQAFGEVRAWKMAFFAAFAVLVGEGAALGHLALQPRFIPYAVAVDQHGVSFPIGPATEAGAEDPAVIASELNRWVFNVRSVTSDPHQQEHMATEAYAYVTAGAGRFLNAHFRDPANDPRVIGQRAVRQVDVRSALPRKPGSTEWVLLWDERTMDRNSGAVESRTWQAYVTIKRLVPPKEDRKTAEQARSNPFRLYITDLSWGEISNPDGLRRGAL